MPAGGGSGDPPRMTETNTRDALSLAFAAVATLVPTGILLVIALLGGAAPEGAEIALFALPVAFLVAAAAIFARLAHR